MENTTSPLSPAARKSLTAWRSMLAGNNFTDLPLIVAADAVFYSVLRQNCLKAREKWNWEYEQNSLVNFYKDL